MTKAFSVVFTPEAAEHLVALYKYIAEHASPTVASRYADGVVAFCEGLGVFPHRGAPRDAIRRGLRVTNYKRRTVIAFEVDDATARVAILGVYYGGRDYESGLAEADEDE